MTYPALILELSYQIFRIFVVPSGDFSYHFPEQNTLSSMESSQRTLDWSDVSAEFERYSVMSWAELVDDTIESREPGHALHMHEKLSSPSRKR